MMTSTTLVAPIQSSLSLTSPVTTIGSYLLPNYSLPQTVKEYTRALLGQAPSNASSTAGIADPSSRVSTLSIPVLRFPFNIQMDFAEDEGRQLEAIFETGPPDWVLQLRAEMGL